MANLEDILFALGERAKLQQPRGRPDLGGSWGGPDYLGNAPVMTYLGRVARPGQTLEDVMATMPQGVEGEDQLMRAVPAMPSALGALGLRWASGKIASVSPPWLEKRLSGFVEHVFGLPRDTDKLREELGRAIIDNPNDPLGAVTRRFRALGSIAEFPGGGSQEDLASAIIDLALNPIPLRRNEYTMLNRLVQPNKLTEMKRWAHGILENTE